MNVDILPSKYTRSNAYANTARQHPLPVCFVRKGNMEVSMAQNPPVSPVVRVSPVFVASVLGADTRMWSLYLVLTHGCGLGSRTDRCLDCPVGKYGNQQAAASESLCTDCSAGSFSDVRAAASSAVCQVCGSNLFSKAGATACSFWCVLSLGLVTAADTISHTSSSSCVLIHLSTLPLCKLMSLLFSCSVH